MWADGLANDVIYTKDSLCAEIEALFITNLFIFAKQDIENDLRIHK